MTKLLGTKTYIVLGLVSLVSSALLAASFIGLIPDRSEAVRQGRLALAEAIAAGSTAVLSSDDPRKLDAVLRFVMTRNEDVLSIGVRTQAGKLVMSAGDHARNWVPDDAGQVADSQVKVPVWAGSQAWGQVELRFKPLGEYGLAGILKMPLVRLMLFVGALCFLGFHVYLGRVLRHLDPSQAIPGRVRSALDSLTEGLLVIDQKRNIVLANAALVKLLGRTNDQLMGTQASLITWLDEHGQPLGAASQPWEHALEQGTVQKGVVMRLEGADGRIRTFVVNCSPVLGTTGRPGGVLISLEDITVLEQNKVELRRARDEAEAANVAKSEFLANMSHEIRTPMNAILGFTELMRRGYSKSAQESTRHLNTIHTSGRHLLDLINDILDLSKVEAGHIDIESIAVAPHAIVRQALLELGVKAQEKGISLTARPTGLLPETVKGDPSRLRQIMLNLLSNAIKFTDRGGVEVVLRYTPQEGAGLYEMEVHDSGIGIPADRIETMFEPFTQADASITRRFGGTGLGLTISRKFARAMGGDIVARSEPGVGSTLTLSFGAPVLKGVRMLTPDEVLAGQADIAGPQLAKWAIPASRVLVVDDGVENRELVSLVLAEHGLWVEEAENGQVALDKVQAAGFDLILMDMQMPVLDGYSATRQLRGRGVTTPIIALTANAMKGYEEEVLAAGCTAYVTKPVDIDALLATVASLLGGSRVAASVPEPVLLDAGTQEHRQDHGQNHGQEGVAPPAVAALAVPPGPETHEPIYSRLAGNTRLAPIVAKFAARLSQQMGDAREAWGRGDSEEVARFGHWLAGAAGTMGYDDFTVPARELERVALLADGLAITAALDDLGHMAVRIVSPLQEEPSA